MKRQKAKGKRQILFFFAFLLPTSYFLLPTFYTPKAHAQSLSLSISPPILEVLIKPGKSITQVYKITNQGEPVILTPRLVQLTEAGIKEDKDFKPESWITLLTRPVTFGQPFLLKQGEERELLLRINPPTNFPEQEIYRVLLFSTTPNPESETSQVNFSQTIGSIILINVSATGLAKKEAQLIRFEAPIWLDSFDPLKVTIEIKNTGNTLFRPIGQLTLKGPVGTGSFKLDPNIILTNQKRLLTTETSKNNQSSTTLFLPGFFLGKYQIEFAFTLDEGTIKLSQNKSFYALPWKLCLFIIALTIAYFLIRKNRQKSRHLKLN